MYGRECGLSVTWMTLHRFKGLDRMLGGRRLPGEPDGRLMPFGRHDRRTRRDHDHSETRLAGL